MGVPEELKNETMQLLMNCLSEEEEPTQNVDTATPVPPRPNINIEDIRYQFDDILKKYEDTSEESRVSGIREMLENGGEEYSAMKLKLVSSDCTLLDCRRMLEKYNKEIKGIGGEECTLADMHEVREQLLTDMQIDDPSKEGISWADVQAERIYYDMATTTSNISEQNVKSFLNRTDYAESALATGERYYKEYEKDLKCKQGLENLVSQLSNPEVLNSMLDIDTKGFSKEQRIELAKSLVGLHIHKTNALQEDILREMQMEAANPPTEYTGGEEAKTPTTEDMAEIYKAIDDYFDTVDNSDLFGDEDVDNNTGTADDSKDPNTPKPTPKTPNTPPTPKTPKPQRTNPFWTPPAPDNRQKVVNQTYYKKNTAVVAGKTVEYKVVQSNIDEALKKSKVNKTDLEDWVHFLTVLLVRQFSSAHIIAIDGYQVIINGICWTPTISDLSECPLDIASYIENGELAYLLDWATVCRRLKPKALSISSADLAFGTIAPSLRSNKRGKVGVATFFKCIPSLYILEVGGDTVRRNELNTPKAEPLKKKAGKVSRFKTLMGGYSISVSKNTQSLQDFAFKNLKEYATHRGDKNWFLYAGGTVARAGGLAVTGLINLIGHIGHGIKTAVKEGFKPVSTDEIY